jgi:hypothetical protein
MESLTLSGFAARFELVEVSFELFAPGLGCRRHFEGAVHRNQVALNGFLKFVPRDSGGVCGRQAAIGEDFLEFRGKLNRRARIEKS